MKKSNLNPCSTRKRDTQEAAKLGKAILKGKAEAIVLYKKHQWDIKELLEHLAERVSQLERTQCKPNAKCLFEGQKYLEEKYLGE